MRKISVLLSLLSLTTLTYSKHVPNTVKAGIVTSFKQEFLDECKDSFNDKFSNVLKYAHLPDFKNNFPVGSVNLEANITNIKITDFKIDTELSNFSLHEVKPQLDFKFVNCSLSLNFDYNVTTVPLLVDDVGRGQAQFEGLNISVLANPSIKDHFLQFDFTGIKIEGDSFSSKFDGEDIATLLNDYQNVVQEYVKKTLFGELTTPTKKSISAMVNQQLLKVPRNVVMKDNQLEVDYGLVNEGIMVHDAYMSLIVDGTFKMVNQTEPVKKPYTQLPVHVPEGGAVQILISDYSLNRILEVAVEEELIQYTLADQTSANIDAIITEFESSFGVHDNVTIKIEGALDYVKYPPKIQVFQGDTIMDFFIEIHMVNPFGDNQDAALIIAKITTGIDFTIADDMTVSGDIDNLKLAIADFFPYYLTKTTVAQISQRIHIFVPLLQAYLNKLLDQGIKLPVPESLTRFILNETITEHDGFISISGDIDFDYIDISYVDPFEPVDLVTPEEPIVPEDNSGRLFLSKFARRLDANEDNNGVRNNDKNKSKNGTDPIDNNNTNLSDMDKDMQQSNNGTERPKFTPQQREKALKQYYSLVEDVYVLKLENGDLKKENYHDVYSAVDDINYKMTEDGPTVNEDEKYKGWTPEMKEAHKELTENFKNGDVKNSDLSLSKIAEIGDKIVNKIQNEVNSQFKSIKERIFSEASNDINAIENFGASVNTKLNEVMGAIFGGF